MKENRSKYFQTSMALAMTLFSGCASLSRTYDLKSGETGDEVNQTLGVTPVASNVGTFSGKEVRTYRLYTTSPAGQVAYTVLTCGLYPLFAGKANYYTLFDKDGKLIAFDSSSYVIAALTFVGLPADAVYKKWGVPQQETSTPSGGKAYVYLHNTGMATNTDYSGQAQTRYGKRTRGNINQDGTFNSETRGVASTDLSGTESSSSYQLYCKSTFITDQSGTVTDVKTVGNNCNY